jgi:plastocyanin
MGRRIVWLVPVACAALALGACASGKSTGLPAGPTSPPAGATCTGRIEMNDQLQFVPQRCTVKVGTTVTWVVVGSVPHTATAEPSAPVQFDSGTVEAGKEFTFTFQQPGEIPYYCKLHAAPGTRAGMVGTIVVEAA